MKSTITKLALVVALCIACGMYVTAQSKTDMQAIALYNKADMAYNNASYEEALGFLKEAEDVLGRSNSKILYLKIQTLDLLAKIDAKKTSELQNAISRFYQITDRNTYPRDKYMRVTSIEIELKERLANEESDFQKLKTSEDVGEYDAFFNNYPNSKYEAQLKPKYNQLLEKQKLKQQKAFEQNWKDRNLPLLKKYQSKGTAEVILGSILLPVGSAMLLIGCLNSPDLTGSKDPLVFTKYQYEYSDEHQVYFKRYDGYFHDEVFLYSMISVGSAAVISSLFLLPYGCKHIKVAKKLKQEAKEKSIELSLLPALNFYQNNYSVGLNLKF